MQRGRFVYAGSRNGRGGRDIAYRIKKKDHDVIDAMRRVGLEQIEAALESAEGEGDLATRVHDIRKRMKKLRGLIRLVRPVFADYEAENRHFRDTARAISGPRDAQVMVDTLDRLLERHEEPLDRDAFAGLREVLAEGSGDTVDLASVAESLRLARERARLWTLGETGWDALAGGLGKTYRRARRAQRGSSDAEMHEWRKRVKYHWYHTRLLRRIWPEGMQARAATADAMGECLGLHHDLTVLGSRVAAAGMTEQASRVLQALIDRRKAELEQEARQLAPRLLAEKPKALVRRWGELWTAWRG